METIRCGKCNRKLAEAEFTRLAIKCPRCGVLNVVKAMSLSPERHRASIRKEPTDGNSKQQDAP
ncbi:MAG: Com family DNA-binding transcriptional regulator [Proteobacteria bacterium]|nr:Com family DNA-binding transcriptional regulator [Pseudomonadota bacterium]